MEETQEPSQEDNSKRQATKIKRNLYFASLDSWEMKPLEATSGMKEGTVNEVEVLKALPAFFRKNKAFVQSGL